MPLPRSATAIFQHASSDSMLRSMGVEARENLHALSTSSLTNVSKVFVGKGTLAADADISRSPARPHWLATACAVSATTCIEQLAAVLLAGENRRAYMLGSSPYRRNRCDIARSRVTSA